MGERHGVCIECGEYFMNGEEPYICNDCLEKKKEEEKKKENKDE